MDADTLIETLEAQGVYVVGINGWSRQGSGHWQCTLKVGRGAVDSSKWGKGTTIVAAVLDALRLHDMPAPEMTPGLQPAIGRLEDALLEAWHVRW